MSATTETTKRTRNSRATIEYICADGKLKRDGGTGLYTGIRVLPRDANGKETGEFRDYFMSNYNEEMQNRLAFQTGFKNKYLDSWSSPESDVLESAEAVHAQLTEGNWSARGGESAEKTTLFLEAYARHTFKMPGGGESRGMDAATWLATCRTRLNDVEAGDDAEAKAKMKNARANASIVELQALIQQEKIQERLKAAKAAARQNKTAVELI